MVIWASGALDPEYSPESDLVTSVKRGLWAIIVVFLAYSLLQAPPTLLIRPHPAIWRLVHGMAVISLVALTFLLFQKRDDARKIMKFLHPDLGVELPERSYGADCRIYTAENPTSRFKNVYDTLFDELVLAHVLGWWGKSYNDPESGPFVDPVTQANIFDLTARLEVETAVHQKHATRLQLRDELDEERTAHQQQMDAMMARVREMIASAHGQSPSPPAS